ncbi:TcpQ domain-containing protein [Candidatus Pantoea floridensis]|uniref:Type IV pili sensor histidine kinase and response regulator n=1 Tax=Candidatus Pantoea floridensis TaxID=1938870 RepID=A0A286DS03_9GAMM|nr:TcpQ domain-containing protein [Pantoea floridensis]PIF06890.1 type IV pili sensor histidine kinase/response regulator [Enterobacteriaceae bacterium JKS000233]SOD61425.1 type IV pili sensor histidine kinase and response regulator [Pantoea floridensis]
MSFTERAGLIPVLLLTGCAQQTVYTGPPSGSVVDSMLSRSAADISAMQYRVHQTGPTAQRPVPPAAKPVRPLTPGITGASALTAKSASSPPASAAGTGPADGFIRQDGAAPTMRAALRKIVPPGHTVTFDKAVSADAPELWRWTGNDRWQYVADKMLAPHGLKITLNDKTRTVTVEPAQQAQNAPASGKNVSPPVPPAAPAKATAADTVKVPSPATGRNPFHGDKGAAPVSAPPASRIPAAPAIAPAAVQLRHWRIETGSTVKDWLYTQGVAETCAVPGIKTWTIAWLTPTNYRVDAPLNFDGSFREMLNRLFTLYGTAKVPLYAGVRAAQCVVTVDDKEVQ